MYRKKSMEEIMENLRKPIGWLILLLSLCLIVAPILGAPIIDEPTTLIQ